MEAIEAESADELADKMKIVFDDDELAQFFDGFEPLDPTLSDGDGD
ncbi:MAG: hypothetical protein HYZ27_00875 [Deltaproteobacteria bacterium]|nr:hypothetical protein [Deltaproteobacteria bacterium]